MPRTVSDGDPLQAQQRDLTIRRVKETEKELSRQLRQQKEQYEATIQRHLSFIDQVTRLWEAMWGERTWSADPGLVSLSRDWSIMLTAGAEAPAWFSGWPSRGALGWHQEPHPTPITADRRQEDSEREVRGGGG